MIGVEKSCMSAGFELTDHTADVGVHAWGASAADVFEQAALGMVSLMYYAATVAPRERIEFEMEAADGELLLASWLNELLFVIEARRVAFARFEVIEAAPAHATQVEQDPAPAAAALVCVPWRLRAAGVGEALDARRHDFHPQVKAATLHGLELRRTDRGWEGRVLLDV